METNEDIEGLFSLNEEDNELRKFLNSKVDKILIEETRMNNIYKIFINVYKYSSCYIIENVTEYTTKIYNHLFKK